MKELPKVYEPQQVEGRIYRMWMDNDCFKATPDPDKKPFSIVMPPPNVTGQLHMGHAMDATLQDILTRFMRMQCYDALWLPGTDHAVIATQLLVDLLDALLGHAGVAQNAAGLALVLGKRHQQMLGHHKAVAHLGGLLLGLLDDADELIGKTHLLTLARNLRRVVDGVLRGACELSRVGTDALDDHGDIALAGTEQGRQQVNRLHRAGLRVGSRAHGGLQRLARRHC